MKPRNPKIELKAVWSKREEDIIIYYPNQFDGHFFNSLLNYPILEKSFIQLLGDRGYDIKTLKISIKRIKK